MSCDMSDTERAGTGGASDSGCVRGGERRPFDATSRGARTVVDSEAGRPVGLVVTGVLL